MEPIPQDPNPTTALAEGTAGVKLDGAPVEGPERNGLGTWLLVASAVVAGVVAGIATIEDAVGTASGSAKVAAALVALASVGKFAQAIAKILAAARNALPLIESSLPPRQIVRSAAVDPETARAARIALANVIDERRGPHPHGNVPPAASSGDSAIPPDEADQTKLAASDGDPMNDGEDQAAPADMAAELDDLDDLPGGADAAPIDDEPEAVR